VNTTEADTSLSATPMVPDHLLNILSAGMFFLFTALFLATLCPTVYWGDSAEYIITSFTLRNAHPTGYPLYSLVGKAATLLPVGTIAFRVSLLSALLGASTLSLTFRLLARMTGSWLMPLAAVASLGFSRTFWSLSTIPETLTLNLLLVALLFSLLLVPGAEERRTWSTAAFLGGLACTNHFQALLVLPGLALIFLGRHPLWKNAASRIPAPALFFLAGLSVYIYLPLRSGYPYPNIYPDADTAWGFFSYYLGRTAYLGPDRLRGWGEALGLLPQVLASIPRELGWPLTLLAFPGLLALWEKSRAAAAAILSVAALTILSAVFNGPTGTTYKMYLYSAQAYWALAILGCLGGTWLIRRVGPTWSPPWRRAAVPALCLAGAALLVRANFRYNDLSSHDWATRYAEAELATLPRDAIYLPGKDNPNNLSTYWRFVKGYRQDLALIPQEGLMSGYYHRRIRETYPGLNTGDYEAIEQRLGAGSLGTFTLVASYFRDLAVRNPEHPVFVYPNIPEEYLEMPREPWGDTFRILPPGQPVSSGGPTSPLVWDAFEMALAQRAPPFLFDDFVIPGLADIRQRFGWFFLKEGNPARAIAEYRRSVQILPSSPGLRYNFARALHALGRLDEATRELEAALKLDAAYRPAGLLLARVKIAAGDVQGAGMLVERFRAGGTSAELHAVDGELALVRGDQLQAVESLRLAVEAAPGDTGYLLVYGRALYASRHFEELLAVGRRLVAAGERFEGLYAQGLAFASLGQLPEAAQAYREALSVDPAAFQVLNNLGVVFLLQGRKEEAAESFRRSLSINPDYEPARQNLQRLP